MIERKKKISSVNCHTTKLVAKVFSVRYVFKIRLTLVEITSITSHMGNKYDRARERIID